jgi:lipopolysaccharide biosynthesis glycosyltransferase
VIASAADGRYALPLAVMLRSAADALAPGSALVAYVADGGIGHDDRDRIRRALDDRIEIRWVTPRWDDLEGLPLWGRMQASTYHRLSVASWIPAETTRVIWLDADLLLLADVTRLAAEGLGGRTALAARDPLVPTVASRFGVAGHVGLGLRPDAPYFNAGVMALDLERWRDRDVEGRALAYLRRTGRGVTFWDQEALNAVLAEDWGELDPRWNWSPTLDRPVARAAASEARILHFSGMLKPWTFPGTGPHHDLYYSVLDETAWAGWRPRRTARGRVLAAYEASRLRGALRPAEDQWLRIVRATTRRTVPPVGAGSA